MFFDGFDEISSNRKDEITRSICQITKKYSRNKYILTSRPFVNIELLENFHNYEVCDLSIEEIKSFIEKQFYIASICVNKEEEVNKFKPLKEVDYG